MYLVDFEYDGETLSSFGCMACSIVTPNEESVSLGSSLTFSSVVNNATYVSQYTNYDYEGNITARFDIIKNNCHGDILNFDSGEISHIMRWLNREECNKFIPIYNEMPSETVYYIGTFNTVSAIKVGDNVIGFSLVFTANAPYGFLDSCESTNEILQAGDKFVIYDDSDKIGIIYPTSIKIECKNQGNLIITNELDERVCRINNVENGEVITMDCQSRVITTTSSTHTTLYNDFNYNFPRIINNKNLDANIFECSIPCVVTVEHHPIRKVGII